MPNTLRTTALEPLVRVWRKKSSFLLLLLLNKMHSSHVNFLRWNKFFLCSDHSFGATFDGFAQALFGIAPNCPWKFKSSLTTRSFQRQHLAHSPLIHFASSFSERHASQPSSLVTNYLYWLFHYFIIPLRAANYWGRSWDPLRPWWWWPPARHRCSWPHLFQPQEDLTCVARTDSGGIFVRRHLWLDWGERNVVLYGVHVWCHAVHNVHVQIPIHVPRTCLQ